MKKIANFIAAALLCLWLLPMGAGAETLLIPGGQVVGLELGDRTVTVAAFDEELGETARSGGLEVGDIILRVDGMAVTKAEDVRGALARSHGTVKIEIRRGDQRRTLTLTPAITGGGPRLGVYLRQGVTGIGTVTYYDPDQGVFGTLGHGVNQADGALLEMTEGRIYPAQVLSVRKGAAGEPGQLMGAVVSKEAIGVLTGNTTQGLFGKTQTGWKGTAVPVAEAAAVHTGPAVICSTVSDTTVREYSVEILKIYPKSRQNGRNLLIRVTDPALLDLTGGIVQGM